MLREPTNSSSANMGQLLPQVKEFVSQASSSSRYYYFTDNPWKLPSCNNVQEIFRCCIVCGTDRFTDREWNELNEINSSPVICGNDSCFHSMRDMDKFIPRRLYRIETSTDQARIQDARVMEFFEHESANKCYLRKAPSGTAVPLVMFAACNAGNCAESYSRGALDRSRSARILVGSVGTIISCVAKLFFMMYDKASRIVVIN